MHRKLHPVDEDYFLPWRTVEAPAADLPYPCSIFAYPMCFPKSEVNLNLNLVSTHAGTWAGECGLCRRACHHD